MTFERGSLILVGYVARLDDGTVIEAANYDGNVPDGVRNFNSEPKLVSVGDPSYPVLPGFGRALADAELNAPQTVTIQPADAYGERRRDKVKMITSRKLGKDADRYAVGDTVEVNNSTGVILSMGSGRVRVDFNHMFAGKPVTYEFVVLKRLESDTDKIEAMLAHAGLLEDYDPLRKSGESLDDDLDDDLTPEDEDSTDEDLDAVLKDDLGDDDLDDDLDAPGEGGDSTDDYLDGNDDLDDDDDLDDLDDDDDLDDLDDLDDDDDLDDLDDETADEPATSGYTLTGGALTVAVPPSLYRDPKIQDKKHLIQMDLFRFVPHLREVRFLETHRNAAI